MGLKKLIAKLEPAYEDIIASEHRHETLQASANYDISSIAQQEPQVWKIIVHSQI